MNFKQGIVSLALLATAAQAQAQPDALALAAKVDAHYNHLASLRAAFRESYTGMGQRRTETGTLLLRKPGRMRWSYSDGKLFLLHGKYAISYTPGDPQAQRVPAKQLDDMRSPLRFLLGHTRLEKELDRLQVNPGPDETAVLSGKPHYASGPGEQRLQRIFVTVNPSNGAIVGLRLEEIDGTTTDFTFSDLVENAPSKDADFHFAPPAGVAVIDGMPPA